MPVKAKLSDAQKIINRLIKLKGSWCAPKEFYKKWNTQRKALQKTKEYQNFLRECRERANFRCERCPSTSRRIEVHHKIRVYDDPSLALDSRNGMVLCKACHNKEHKNGSGRT